MKAWRFALRLTFAGLLLLALAFASYRAGFNARCTTGSATAGLTGNQVKESRVLGFGWAANALACRVGEYVVMTPNGAGQGESAYILRKGRPFVIASAQETALFDDSGQRILFSVERANSNTSVTYTGFDPARGALIENFDLDADGTFDYRLTEINGRRVKQEYRVGEQWLETVEQDGRTGVVFNGQFMRVADAKKLSAKSTEAK